MKLFAPRNEGGWSLTDPTSWWPMLGSTQTVTGKRISEDSALTYSAVCAATRIISETLAALPLNLMEQVDARTTNKALNHPLYRLLHDIPNPEQDSMCFMDMQTAFLPQWGNAFSEIQRDLSGKIVALWPIHPSRIPDRNITRNETDPGQIYRIVVGQPGEIVYWVKNDDGTVTPIPASDVLHVPGVLSRNGITGQSIVRLAANSIGIGMATEEHAGALFKNGAVTNMVIKSPKVVGKETAGRLREQWQSCFGGVQNHYKTLLLEEGMEPFPIQMKPEDTQLILARQFGITEIARWFRLPPHLLADLSRSTFSNIEAENLSFVVHSMLPWIVRWEKALYRQLLTPAEQKRYRFKFNVNGLLRGDTAARAQFYQSMFQLGAFSTNDILACEDMNPVPGGDQRFIPGNNLIPLEKATEMADAQIEKLTAPPPAAAPAAPPSNAETYRRLAELRQLQEQLIVKVEMRDAAEEKRVAAVEFIKDQARIIENLSESVAKFPAAVQEVAESITETRADIQQTISDSASPLADAATQNAAVVASIPGVIAEAVNSLAPPLPEPPDTKLIEEVAVREAQIAAKQAEIDEKLRIERETTDRVLILSVKRAIDKLAEQEWKEIDRAIEKPLEWKAWREKYYARFRRYFKNDLMEYIEDARLCGIVLDPVWGADRYASQSITDLKTLDDAAKDNFHDRIKECCDHFRKRQWTERSKLLAAEMVERGRKMFNERKQNVQATD